MFGFTLQDNTTALRIAWLKAASMIGWKWILKDVFKKMSSAVYLVLVVPANKLQRQHVKQKHWGYFCDKAFATRGGKLKGKPKWVSLLLCQKKKKKGSLLSGVLLYKWGGPKNTERLVEFRQLQRLECPGIQFILFLFISTVVYIVIWRSHLYSCFQLDCSGQSVCEHVCGSAILFFISIRIAARIMIISD